MMSAVAKLDKGSPLPPDDLVVAPVLDEPKQHIKVRFKAKAAAFVLATLSLSWFFEGWRQINTVGNIQSYAIIILGTASTLFTLCVWAYWIYMEEKSKGTLKKRIVLFESVSRFLSEKESANKSSGNNGE